MDSPSMVAIVRALADAGLRVARFEFGYMARRRDAGTRTPPPRSEALVPELQVAIAELDAAGPLIIGGKSMGGRVASMIADELHHSGAIVGLLCLGYPFHPQGKPERLRTAHLGTLQTPTLICQGTRDPLGSRDEVAGYVLSKQIEMLWLKDGDHDLKPRKGMTGLTAADHLKTISEVVRQWAGQLGP